MDFSVIYMLFKIYMLFIFRAIYMLTILSWPSHVSGMYWVILFTGYKQSWLRGAWLNSGHDCGFFFFQMITQFNHDYFMNKHQGFPHVFCTSSFNAWAHVHVVYWILADLPTCYVNLLWHMDLYNICKWEHI